MNVEGVVIKYNNKIVLEKSSKNMQKRSVILEMDSKFIILNEMMCFFLPQ